jgi:hypothetical protein
MPDERFTHRKEGRSRKLSMLTDFEYRVWSQYRLSANDFGVMLYSPAPLISDSKYFEDRDDSMPEIRRALDRMVELELLLAFEHQGERYVCSAEWQEYQTIRYPRESHHPIPNGDALAKCSPATRALFDVSGLRSALRRVKSKRRAEAARDTAKPHCRKISERVQKKFGKVARKSSVPLAVSRLPLAEDPPVAPRRGAKLTRAERAAAKRVGVSLVDGPTWREVCRERGHGGRCQSPDLCGLRAKAEDECPHQPPKCTTFTQCSERSAVAS